MHHCTIISLFKVFHVHIHTFVDIVIFIKMSKRPSDKSEVIIMDSESIKALHISNLLISKAENL